MVTLFISFQFVDFVDIFLVALLMYEIYKLIRGTAGMNIFFGLLAFYIIWLVVRVLHMEMLTRILGQFISVGVLALVVLFQSEIRKFLTVIGNRYLQSTRRRKFSKFLNIDRQEISQESMNEIVDAVFTMSESKTGALIVLASRKEMILPYVPSGEILDARISSALLQNIFYKNTPLHDGAVLIVGKQVIAAKCVLPMTRKNELPMGFGMRHRSAIGMSEETDTLVLIVSEQTGDVSRCQHGEIYKIENKEELIDVINKYQETK